MDQKLLLVIATLALAATAGFMSFNHDDASKISQDFEAFKATHGKVYASEEEEAYRFAVYMQHKSEHKAHNAQGLEWTLGENQFTDLTHEEFKQHFLGYKAPEWKGTNNVVHYSKTASGSVDWTTVKDKVQAVKDQGQCGSCWAFSTMGSSESQQAIKDNKLENFAEQQLVDCDTASGDQGCNGGLMDNAFGYLKTAGYCLTSSYAYTATGGTCKADKCTKSAFKISGFTDVAKGDVTSLASALDAQPVSIAVDANNWQSYSSGIFSNCGESLDHGVLLVGYNAESWKIKNSWASSWGENGFIRIKTGNTCGLANAASYPHK